jgi:hypothetical protein
MHFFMLLPGLEIGMVSREKFVDEGSAGLPLNPSSPYIWYVFVVAYRISYKQFNTTTMSDWSGQGYMLHAYSYSKSEWRITAIQPPYEYQIVEL